MKARITALLVALAALLPARSQAFLDLGQSDWLSGQNSLLVELLATEIEELANITETLRNMRMVAQAGNEALALARSTFRAYKAVRDYSREDLIRDAREGLYNAFPDLEGIESEVNLYGDQWVNRGDFWSFQGTYDGKMGQVVTRVLEHGYQATIWPTVFPEAMVYRQNPSPLDLHIWQIYSRTGQKADAAIQKTALAALAVKAANFVADAEDSGNLELAAQAATTQLMVQEVSNSTEFLNLYKAEMASKEAARITEQGRRDAMRASLTNHAREIFAPGAMLRE